MSKKSCYKPTLINSKFIYIVPAGKIHFDYIDDFFYYEEYHIYNYNVEQCNYFDNYIEMMEWIQKYNLVVLNKMNTIKFDVDDFPNDSICYSIHNEDWKDFFRLIED